MSVSSGGPSVWQSEGGVNRTEKEDDTKYHLPAHLLGVSVDRLSLKTKSNGLISQ